MSPAEAKNVFPPSRHALATRPHNNSIIAGVDTEALYRKYGPMVLRRCRQMLKDEQDALDATQDVFVKLFEARNRLSDEFPSSLLYRMATNTCLNKIRDHRRKPEIEGEELLYSIASAEETESRFAALAVLERLFLSEPESTRTIAVLHYVDGMTLEETAREVKMSVSGVRKRLRNLRATLSQLEEP